MIIYKDILSQLKNAGYSTYRLRQEKLLSECVIQRIRSNQPITTDTIDCICNLLHCNIDDIIDHVEEPLDKSESL